MKNIDKVTLVAYDDLTKDGKEYINVSKYANSTLGKLLRSERVFPFISPYGECNSIYLWSKAITTKDFPLELLSKKGKITKEEYKKMFGKRITVKNYWALIAYAYCQRIKADKYLTKLMKNNILPYTSFDVQEPRDFFGKTILLPNKVNSNMVNTITIIHYISKLIQNDKFDDENIEELINSCKSDPNSDLLEGVQGIKFISNEG